MYSQILIHENDTNYQRILFRPNPTSPIKGYAVKTVTFGVNCAPYLAIRTLIQLSHDSQDIYPKGSKIILSASYVDDVLSRAHDFETAIESLTRLRAVLNKAGFPIKRLLQKFRISLNKFQRKIFWIQTFSRFIKVVKEELPKMRKI